MTWQRAKEQRHKREWIFRNDEESGMTGGWWQVRLESSVEANSKGHEWYATHWVEIFSGKEMVLQTESRGCCNIVHVNCQPKKCTTWGPWVKIYLRPNEDYSPGDRLSDGSKKLPQWDRRRSVYMWFWRWELHAVKHTFWQKVAASHREQMSPLIVLVLFWIWGDARIWVHKIFFWKYNYLKSYSASFF